MEFISEKKARTAVSIAFLPVSVDRPLPVALEHIVWSFLDMENLSHLLFVSSQLKTLMLGYLRQATRVHLSGHKTLCSTVFLQMFGLLTLRTKSLQYLTLSTTEWIDERFAYGKLARSVCAANGASLREIPSEFFYETSLSSCDAIEALRTCRSLTKLEQVGSVSSFHALLDSQKLSNVTTLAFRVNWPYDLDWHSPGVLASILRKVPSLTNLQCVIGTIEDLTSLNLLSRKLRVLRATFAPKLMHSGLDTDVAMAINRQLAVLCTLPLQTISLTGAEHGDGPTATMMCPCVDSNTIIWSFQSATSVVVTDVFGQHALVQAPVATTLSLMTGNLAVVIRSLLYSPLLEYLELACATSLAGVGLQQALLDLRTAVVARRSAFLRRLQIARVLSPCPASFVQTLCLAGALKVLNCRLIDTTDDVLECALTNLPLLESISLTGPTLSAEVLTVAAKTAKSNNTKSCAPLPNIMNHLETIMLHNVGWPVELADVELPRLTSFSVRGSGYYTDIELRQILKSGSLRLLDLTDCRILESDCGRIHWQCTPLKHLSLTDCYWEDLGLLKAILTKTSQLVNLSLRVANEAYSSNSGEVWNLYDLSAFFASPHPTLVSMVFKGYWRTSPELSISPEQLLLNFPRIVRAVLPDGSFEQLPLTWLDS